MSEDRFRKLLEILPDAVFVNTNDAITFCNPAFLRLIGAEKPEDVLGTSPIAFLDDADRERTRARIAALLAHGGEAPVLDETVTTLRGERKRVRVRAMVLGAEDPPSIMVVFQDITERQWTEHRLASILESVSDAIISVDRDDVIRAVNPATCRKFQRTEEELIGAPMSVLLLGGKRSGEEEADAQGVRADGTTFPAEVSVTSFTLDGSENWTYVVHDVTERRKLEAQFCQAHKMEAFGQLAGGVAHDFNNLLTVILGEATQLLADAPEASPLALALADVKAAGERAAALTRQLLAFSRQTVLAPRVVDVNGVVDETKKLLRRLIGEDVDLVTHLAAEAHRVNVDPGQLTQVLMNLAVNARDAMPRGGKLEMATQNVAIDEDGAKAAGAPHPGDYVKISVCDSGEGMTEEVKARVFQPFFTTKEVGKGTGLGLAVVYGIVGQSGGFVALESAPESGSRFDIFLPAAERGVTERPTEALGTTSPSGNDAQGRVLLVEDDDAVRRVALRVLSRMGCTVHVANDGIEALALLESGAVQIDALVTDVVMPRLDGGELVSRLRARYPQLKALYVSGYTDDILVRRGIIEQDVNFLAKPYTPTSLRKAVERLLAR